MGTGVEKFAVKPPPPPLTRLNPVLLVHPIREEKGRDSWPPTFFFTWLTPRPPSIHRPGPPSTQVCHPPPTLTARLCLACRVAPSPSNWFLFSFRLDLSWADKPSRENAHI